MALLTLIILDCVVLGILHLALQEQRIGSNRSAVLQLRLDAESGLRLALGSWTAGIDSMERGSPHRIPVPTDEMAGARVHAERLDEYLFLLESTAAEPPPRAGRAVTRLLVTPPALPPAVDPAPAPIVSAGPVHVMATGAVVSGPPPGCSAAAPSHGILAPPFTVTVEAGAVLDAPAAPLPSKTLAGAFYRIAQLAPSQVVARSDSTIAATSSGVLVVVGNVTIAAHAAFRGLLIASGSVRIESDADMIGVVHAGAGVTVAGHIQWDPCVIAVAIRDAGLDQPRPAGPRAWIPAF
jgi:hypothetical protein